MTQLIQAPDDQIHLINIQEEKESREECEEDADRKLQKEEMIQHNDCVADITPYCTVILLSEAVIEQEVKKIMI